MAVNDHPDPRFKYLAISFNDGNIGIWTYDLKVTKSNGRSNSSSSSDAKQIGFSQRQLLLRPLCRLMVDTCLENDDWKEGDDRCNEVGKDESNEIIGKSVTDEGNMDKSQGRKKKQPQPEGDDGVSSNLEVKSSFCTDLLWLPSGLPNSTAVPLLAAAFTNGLAVYHVLLTTKESNMGENISSTKAMSDILELRPIVYSRLESTLFDKALISWLSLGPRTSPCLSILFENISNTTHSRLVVASLDLPSYENLSSDSRNGIKSSPRPLAILCKSTLPPVSCPQREEKHSDLHTIAELGIVVRHHDGNISAFTPKSCSTLDNHKENEIFSTNIDPYFNALASPVATDCIGVTSSGMVNDRSTYDDVLHIYTDIQSSMGIPVEPSSSEVTQENGNSRRYNLPVIRHWLCSITAGDQKKDHNKKTKLSSECHIGLNGMPSDEFGGSSTSVICEITLGFNSTLVPLTPQRIKRDDSGKFCAILYAPSISRRRSGNLNSTAFVLLDTVGGTMASSGSELTVLQGRDVAFVSSTERKGILRASYTALVLDNDGHSIYEMKRYIDNAGTSESKNWTKEKSYGNILKKKAKKIEMLSLHRIFALLSGELLLLGFDETRKQFCLFTSEMFDLLNSKQALHSNKEVRTSKIWLKEGESFISLVQLSKPSIGDKRNLAISTTKRVLIVSNSQNLCILSEVHTQLTCGALAPLGSHCVAYCSFLSRSCNRAKICYLSCLTKRYSVGVLLNLPFPSFGSTRYLLVALRPDRLVYLTSHSGSSLLENIHIKYRYVRVPIAITRPLSLLEPLVANTLCQDIHQNIATNDSVHTMLHLVIERFGRKMESSPHRDGEKKGIGSFGAGMTTKVVEMLKYYNCTEAISFLLMGHGITHNEVPGKNLPNWVPTFQKAFASSSLDNSLQILANGDYQLSKYLVENNAECVMPRSSDPSSTLSYTLGLYSLHNNRIKDAMKFFDLAGSSSSENYLLNIMLSMQLDPNIEIEGPLTSLCGKSFSKIGTDNIFSSTSSIAALALNLRQRQKETKGLRVEEGKFSKTDDDWAIRWTTQLAPSFQRGLYSSRRTRNHLIGKVSESWDKKTETENIQPDSIWKAPLDESKNIWQSGPFNVKEEILSLDHIEAWLGQRNPMKLGEEGAKEDASAGVTLLQEIIKNNDESSHNDDEIEDVRTGWIDRVGEGRTEDENLSLYYRFVEGVEEDSKWIRKGFSDLSSYHNSAKVVHPKSFRIERSTSNVEKGDGKKYAFLHDLVFKENLEQNTNACLLVEVNRGSSLDVGMLHNSDHSCRQRGSIEFWYFLPRKPSFEISLVRRSVCLPGEPLENLCDFLNKDCILWDLLVLPSGELEFRGSCGSNIYSSEEKIPVDGWNHVCLTFSCQNVTECSVSIILKGVKVASSVVSIIPPQFAEDDLLDYKKIDAALDKTGLMFGLGNFPGLRFTEIRCFACERSIHQLEFYMYDYLPAAKTKFKVSMDKTKEMAGIRTPLILIRPPPSIKSRENPIDPTVSTKDKALDLFSNRINDQNDEFILDAFNSNLFPTGTLSITIHESILLSKQLRPSAAFALVRGPPATRHFGGNRGGLISSPDEQRPSRHGIGSIAICGTEKTVIFTHDRSPAHQTYPIGASGAIISDFMDINKSEYLCCFYAKEKRINVYALHSNTMVVEMQLPTKLNFWRFLPPGSHGGSLTFMLITPHKGFHWMPLEESPHPQTVWRRSSEIQGKKIIAYEEGGNNGFKGIECRATIGLLLLSSNATDSKVEAFCLSLFSRSSTKCMSTNILGASLLCPIANSLNPFTAFEPYLVIVSRVDESESAIVKIFELSKDDTTGDIQKVLLDSETLIIEHKGMNDNISTPTMALGNLPEIFCLCCNLYVIVIIRQIGSVVLYSFVQKKLTFTERKELGNFVIDAAIKENDCKVELVVLLSEKDDIRDGRIATITIEEKS